jgi:hypothetical protein
MKKLAAYCAVVVVTGMFMTGCASMFTEKSHNLSFKSKPDGAEVALGARTCTTPCVLQVTKGSDIPFQATVTKPGYESQNFSVERTFEPWFIANLFSPFGVGFIVDYASGSWAKYEHEYYATMTKKM